jgi:hypothetical protein
VRRRQLFNKKQRRAQGNGMGAAAMAYGDLCSSPEFLSSLYRSSLLPSKHDSHVGETSTSALYFLEPDPLTFLQIQVI